MVETTIDMTGLPRRVAPRNDGNRHVAIKSARNDSELESDLQEIKKEQGKLFALTDRLSKRLHDHSENVARHPEQREGSNAPVFDNPLDSTAAPQNDKPGYKNTFDRFRKDSEFRNVLISGVNAALHTAATITNYMVKDNPSYQILNQLFDKAALFCTKIGAPVLSYSLSAIEALKRKDLFLFFIKMIPTVFLPIIGDANIDTVYGASLGFNQPYDLAVERIEEKMKVDPEYRLEIQEAKKTFSGKAKIVWETFKGMCKEFSQGKLPYKEALFFVNVSFMLIGSLPMILFNRNARNTLPAKFFGVLRNIGGLIGDYGFVTLNSNFKKLAIGGMCSVSAVSSIAKRFVKSDLAAKVLIHLGAALDVTAVSLWNAFNDGNGKKDQAVSFA